jgi:3-dehydroquinate synthetase
LGHTIGHGIEFASEESLLHGECVSIGNVNNLIQGIVKECQIAI